MRNELIRFKTLFHAEEVVPTERIKNSLTPDEIENLIIRHVTGDFGDILINQQAIHNRERIVTFYDLDYPIFSWVYVTTEGHQTTVMYADEYEY